MKLEIRHFIFPVLAVFLSSCAAPHGAFLKGDDDDPVVLAGAVIEDTTLSGHVILEEDLLIPEGVTLSFLPGTQVSVLPSEGTRTDSQFVTTETEIVVRGTLFIDGTRMESRSGVKGSWGGVVATAPAAKVTVRDSTLSHAQYGLLMLSGTGRVSGSAFKDNEIGIAAALGAWLELAGNSFTGNDMATAAWHTANPLKSLTDTYSGNDDDALALVRAPAEVAHRPMDAVTGPRPPLTREYLGEAVITEDTTWSGTVIVRQQVAVMPEATLTIEPGTHVLFSKNDTNGDSLGESWIIVQGTVRVLGEEDSWVLFDAEDPGAQPGDWDSLSIIASESGENLVRYAFFRHGVKAFHTHFSRVRLDHVVFEENLRGIQFQESEDTVLDWVFLRRNQSAARFRDSTVRISNLVAADNVAGVNFLRSKVTASELVVRGSLTESLVSRESETALVRAAVIGNVRGPRFKGNGEKVTVRESMVRGNLTEGLSFNHVRGQVTTSDLSDNGFTGLSVTDAAVTISMSRIAGNGRYAVDNNGITDVDARGNDWGSGSAPDPERIYDGHDEAGIGQVLTEGPVTFSMAMPGTELPPEPVRGEALIVGDVVTDPQRDLVIEPGARVRFAVIGQDTLFDLCSDHPGFPGSELVVRGWIDAAGTPSDPISFTQAGPVSVEGVQWGGVNLVGSRGGRFENCTFTNAATGLHAREAGWVSVADCAFERNLVGLRFSSTRIMARDNLFRYNDAGLRFHEFGGTVEGNTFEGNNTAVFVTGNPEGVFLKNNVFRASRDYHVKLGIHVTDDVVVKGGALRVPEGKKVGDLVFDREDDGDLGRVIFFP